MLENLKDQDDLNAILSFIAVYRLLLLRCLYKQFINLYMKVVKNGEIIKIDGGV